MRASESTVKLLRVIVSVSNLGVSRSFYEQRLGLRFRYTTPEILSLVSDDGIEMLLHERPPRPSDTSVSFGLAVHNLDSIVEDWAQAGGEIVDPPAQQPWGEYMAVVRDPDHHLVCLSELDPAQ